MYSKPWRYKASRNGKVVCSRLTFLQESIISFEKLFRGTGEQTTGKNMGKVQILKEEKHSKWDPHLHNFSLQACHSPHGIELKQKQQFYGTNMSEVIVWNCHSWLKIKMGKSPIQEIIT